MSKSLTYTEHMRIPMDEREKQIHEYLLGQVQEHVELSKNLPEKSDLYGWMVNYELFTRSVSNLRTNGIIETEHNVDEFKES